MDHTVIYHIPHTHNSNTSLSSKPWIWILQSTLSLLINIVYIFIFSLCIVVVTKRKNGFIIILIASKHMFYFNIPLQVCFKSLLPLNVGIFNLILSNHNCLYSPSFSLLPLLSPFLSSCFSSKFHDFLSSWISQNCFLLIWKHKQTISIFQRLVKAFNDGAYSVRNHLRHTHQSKKLNYVRIFKETMGWNHETTNWFGWQLSQPSQTAFNLFQNS